MNTLVMLQGGHTTLIKGIGPHELYSTIEEAQRGQFVFLQHRPEEPGKGNEICVDPGAVVGLLRTP